MGCYLHARSLNSGIDDPPTSWRRRRGRPRQTWLNTVEQDTGLWSARHRASTIVTYHDTPWHGDDGFLSVFVKSVFDSRITLCRSRSSRTPSFFCSLVSIRAFSPHTRFVILSLFYSTVQQFESYHGKNVHSAVAVLGWGQGAHCTGPSKKSCPPFSG